MTKDLTRVANLSFRFLPTAVSLVTLAAVLAAPLASAEEKLLENDNSNNRFSFSGTTPNSTNWPGSGPAVSGLEYFTDGKLLRAYAIGGEANTVTFAGSKLTIDSNFQTRGLDNSFYNIGDLMVASGVNARISNGLDNTAVTVTAKSGGTIRIDSGAILTLNGGNTGRTLTMTAPLSGDGQVSVLSAAGIGTVVLSGTNSYDGDTTVQSTGRLQMGADNAMPNALTPTVPLDLTTAGSGDLILTTGGTFRLAGNNTIINGLAGTGGTVDNIPALLATAQPATLTILGDNTIDGENDTFSGLITDGTDGGVLSLEKSGLGVAGQTTRQIISGTANNYTGTTKVSDGQLQFVGSGSLGTGAITVSTGAKADTWGTLELSGVGSKSNAVTLDGRTSTAAAHIDSVSGANALSGGLALADTAATTENYNLVSSGVVSGEKLTISGTGITRGANTDTNNLNLGGAGSGEVSGVIDMGAGGTNNINKVGGGTWALSGPVSNANDLKVSGGTLALGSAISAAGDMAINGVGSTLKLGGASASAKGLTGTGGTLLGSDSGALSLTLGVGATGADPKTFSGNIANGTGGVVSLTKTGGNRQILSGTNSYTGTTTISDGQLRFSGATSVNPLGGTVTVSGTGSGTLELDTVGTDPRALDLTGRDTGTFHVNNIAGNNNVLSGVVTLAESDTPTTTPDNYNFNVTDGSLTVTNGVKVLAGADTQADPINLNLSGDAGTGAMGSVNLGSALSSDNTIVKTGTGTWSLNAATTNVKDINAKGGTLVFNSAGIAYSGTATIDSGGTLKQGVADAFDGKKIQVNGALDLNGNTASLPGLNGLSTGTVVNTGAGTQRLTVTDTGNFAGVISGAVQLKMNGSGKTQTLSGDNTYTGGTVIADGTVKVVAGGSLGSGAVSIVGTDPGTLELSNAGTLTNAMTLTGRKVPDAHVLSSAGTNVLAGVLTLADSDVAGDTPDNYIFSAATGTVLNITGDIAGSDATNGPRNLNLGGAGDGSVVKVAMAGTVADTLNKDGGGTWTLSGEVTGVEEVKANEGTLEIAGTADVSAVDKFFVADNALMDVDDITGGFNLAADKVLYGSGTVQGQVNALDDSIIEIGGNGTGDVSDLTIRGLLNLGISANLNIDIVGGLIDRLIVTSLVLGSDNESLTFDYNTLGANAYVFVSYTSLSGTFDITAVPTGYDIDYNYLNGNQIALVNQTPVPAPLFLLGLGALIIGVGRRYAKW